MTAPVNTPDVPLHWLCVTAESRNLLHATRSILSDTRPIVGRCSHPGQVGTSTTISISGNARYVKVQLVGTNYLSLAEVKVWGTPSGSAASAVNDYSSTQNPNG